jgi:integrase
MHRTVNRGFLSHDEILRFVRESIGQKYRIAFLLGLHSLRLSEVLALTWSDVDLSKNTIYVHRAAVLDDKNHLTIREQTKTDLSTRTIPIFIPELAAELTKRKKYHKPNERVVPVMPNTVYRAVSTFLKTHRFEQGGFHLLRHSFASLCYYLNVPVLVTCTLGGWSDYNTVYRIYTHLERAKIAQSESELTAFFAPKQDKNGSKSEKTESEKSLKINGKQALSDGGSTPPISTKKALELLDFLRDYIEYSH